jgi:nitronate monooxygenase
MVLAGGVADGVALAAAIQLGCDAAYLGTAIIPALESCAADDFRQAVLDASMDDVSTNLMPTGLNANGVVADGVGPADGGRMFSMGHTAHGVRHAVPVADIVERIAGEYERAHQVRGVGVPA